ncbi:hypothetical protein GCM10008090_29370 [Arenicella chitinivorans]|uniref:Uncharacterized protein n=1 Tax=Arenicella chitinivorans TaxID=1329800 RepID=A0A918VR28_9GAMM|nr:hypothetical protein [Arenicella chitinivorans]GHA17798.1 hypothetical protein GCM10008090_29370 [Arenicella chitinivorans]
MKKLSLLTVALFLGAGESAFAGCGEVPDTPAGLFYKRISLEQVEEISSSVQNYVQEMTLLTECLDDGVSKLNLDAADYDVQFASYAEAIGIAERLQREAVERLSFLAGHAQIESVK